MIYHCSHHHFLALLLAGLLSLPGLLQTISAPTGDNSVNITSLQLLGALPGGGVPRAGGNTSGGAQRVAVEWNVVVLKDARLEGFEVAVTATLSNGQTLNQSQSFSSNARRADFNFNLPSSNTGTGNPGNNNTITIEETKGPSGKGTGNNAPANPPLDCNTKCSRLGGAKRQTCLDDCAKNTPPPTIIRPAPKKFLPSNFVAGFGHSFAPQILSPTKNKSSAPTPAAQAIVVTAVSANITARFSRNTEASATRSFVAAGANSDLTPSGLAQSGNLNITRVSDILKNPAKAKECPAGNDCFDVTVQTRGNGGSFTVNLEAVYANNQRVNAAPVTVNSLAAPIRVKMQRPSGNAIIASVTVNVKGTLSEPFTRTDTETSQQQKSVINDKTIKK